MTQLLQNAAYGSALILAVVLLRRALGGRLVPEARLALWAVCLFRLLTPAAPESVLSLWGLPRLFAQPQQAPSAPAPAPQLYVPAPAAPAPQPDPGISWETVLLVLWLAVGAVLAARYALSWGRTRRAVASAIPLERGDARYAFLPKCARLREGPMDGAPLTFGAVRPTVVLSPGLEGEALECVLAHEGVHAARRDNLWHYVMALALAVHWWNPAVWLMARLLRRDIELSCDRAALRKLGEGRRADYANALVSLATQEEGPAFCQTFGRKAAEERILSIMKFKKTSIIGVIFSLTLVLAVSVAFASEPKDLPDEESTTSSAHADNVKLIFEENKLKQFAIGIEGLEKDLSNQVSKGTFTQAEADQILAQVKSILKDGVLDWTFQADCGLSYESLGRNKAAVCYRDEDGDPVPVSLSEIVARFILPQAMGGSTPADVIDAGEPSTDISGYDVKLPTFNEDGSSVSEDGGVIGKLDYQTYDYTPVTDPDAVSGGPVGGGSISNLDSKARASSGLYDLCTAQDCGTPYDHCHIDGKVVRVYYQDPGLLCAHPDCSNGQPHEHGGVQYAGKAPEAYVILNPEMEPVPSASPAPCTQMSCCETVPHTHDGVNYGATLAVCTLEDCGNNSVHTHNGVTYKGWTGKLPAAAPVPSASPEAVAAQPLVNTAPAVSCGVAGCTETRYHQHANGHCYLLSDTCPVEGCTTPGTHLHGDVCYSCNGAHSGGVCDGSCLVASQPMQSANTTAGQSVSRGHHGGCHHGYGHH